MLFISQYQAVNSEGKVLKTYTVSKDNRKAAAEKLKFDFGKRAAFLSLKKSPTVNLLNR